MSQTETTLTIGGQTYRVHSDAEPDALKRLAHLVDTRVVACNPTGRLTPTQALLYAALTLADDLRTEQTRRHALQQNTHGSLAQLLAKIDASLAATELILTPPSER